MRTLVTGGAGFVGSSVVDSLLGAGHSVDVVDNLSTGSRANLAGALEGGSAKLHVLDLCSGRLGELMEQLRPEVVFHLAAQSDVLVSLQRPRFDAEVNVVGTLEVLEGARRCEARRIVYAASGGTLYGDAPAELLPLNEDAARRPLSPYGVSKAVVLDYLAAYGKLYGLEHRSLALANVYGPRQGLVGEAGVAGIFVDRALAGEAPTIYGDGAQTRDFVHVDDVARAFLLAASEGPDGLFNVGTGQETSVNELQELVGRLAGNELSPERRPPRRGELVRSCLDPSKAASELGWRPAVSLEEGLAAMLAARRGRAGGAGLSSSG
ncbi:MAG: NAD-dependent epimerase/dehydratase [Acidimicrobiaceae bacterium]|nr:NAD-dependent epimerase/dehydratase [Acidimicrobiaceae bacterium]